ncbi:MAG: DUF3892 domain-containing protein [Candidatus Woesebacteria bacterium]|jgi:hypothetical protein
MSTRLITHTRKDNDGDITAIKGSWGMATKMEAIQDIESGAQTYTTTSGTGDDIEVIVVHDPGVKDGMYLRSEPDETGTDNLDNLPDF